MNQEQFSAAVRAGDPKAIKEVAKALRDHGGSVERAGESLGVSGRTVRRWVTDVPALRDKVGDLLPGKGHRCSNA